MPAPHWPALDGLRAIAVGAVVLFHLDRLPGGNLGVDAFFVLSGWLITTRLLDGGTGDGRLDLPTFWAARVRRLLPASLLVITSVVVLWPALGIVVPSLPRDARWALLWASNWGTITGGGDYWSRFGEPSPLTHFWSLAVEEQLYLVWPALLAVVLRPGGRRRGVTVAVLATVLAVASVAWMRWSYDPADPTATYLHTFARAHSLLAGAALAGVTHSIRGRRLAGRAARRALPVAVAVAVGIVVAASSETDWLFSWGFPTFAIAMGVIVVAVVDGAGAAILGARPLRWIGDRSYGLYLWHWPVILLLTEERAGLSGLSLDLVRVLVSTGLAAASYQLLEMPIRRRRSPRAIPVVVGATAATTLVLFVHVSSPSSTPAVPDEPSTVALGDADARPAASSTAAAGPALTSLSQLPTEPTPTAVAPVAAPVGPPVAPPPAPPPPPPPAPTPVRVLVAGDSTAVHLANALLPYAAAHPDDIVAGTAAFPGCGLTAADDGRVHLQANADGSTSEVDISDCTSQWRTILQRVPAEQIDVVLVNIGAWDGVDIRLGDGEVVSVGDPRGQALVERAYRDFVDQVEGAGARVVWVTPPDLNFQWEAVEVALDDPARWVNLRSVIDALPVEQIDLEGWLQRQGLAGPDGRPDGVHLADGVNEVFAAEVVVPGLVDVVAGDA